VRRLFPILAAALLAACPASTHATPDAGPVPTDGGCGAGFLGDPSKDIDFEFRALHADGTDTPLADGGDLALIFPPQGGRVAFVGVRATNLDPCSVQLTGALRDEPTQQVRVDARTVNLLPSGDGWGTSAPASQSISAARDTYSNVPLCPNQWASSDVFDHEFQLEVTLLDRTKRTMTKSIKVTPRCAEPDRAVECRCLCKLGYVLGEACGAEDDAGPADAGGDR
jgi:hypothetical protein